MALTRDTDAKLTEELRSWRTQGDGKNFVQLQVFASSGLRLARRATFTHTLALAALAGVGQGQGVFVNNHSTAI